MISTILNAAPGVLARLGRIDKNFLREQLRRPNLLRIRKKDMGCDLALQSGAWHKRASASRAVILSQRGSIR